MDQNLSTLAKTTNIPAITDSYVITCISNYMNSFNNPIPVKDIQENKPLIDSFRSKLYQIKAIYTSVESIVNDIQLNMTTTLSTLKSLSAAYEDPVSNNTAITTACSTIYSGTGTVLTPILIGHNTAINGTFNLLEQFIKESYKNQLISCEGQIANMLGLASDIGYSIPGISVMISTITTLKNTLI